MLARWGPPVGRLRAEPGDDDGNPKRGAPGYLEENVEQQRGKGVYGDSVRALRLLNDLGYGQDDARRLHLDG